MNSLPLSPAVFSYATLQGKPLPSSPVEHCNSKLVPRPFRSLQFFISYSGLKIQVVRPRGRRQRCRRIWWPNGKSWS